MYRFLLPLRFVWFVVYIGRMSFKLHGCCGEFEGLVHKPIHHTRMVAAVIPTDRPKSISNRRVMELFGGLYVFSLCLSEISVDIVAFVIGMVQIPSLFLTHKGNTLVHITIHSARSVDILLLLKCK